MQENGGEQGREDKTKKKVIQKGARERERKKERERTS